MSDRKKLDKYFSVSGYYEGLDLKQVIITHLTGSICINGDEFHRACRVVKGEELFSDGAETWRDRETSIKVFCSHNEKTRTGRTCS